MAQSPAVTVEETRSSFVTELTRNLRVAEKVFLAFLAYVIVASFVFPLSLGERLTLLGLNLVTSALIIWLAKFGRMEKSKLLATLRDWIPCFLVLLAYRESGLFFRPDPTHRLDYLFVTMDRALLKNPWVEGFLEISSPWFQRYLEFAYFLCYPLVPLGLGTLYLAGRKQASSANSGERENSNRSTIDHYWTAVLLAALSCYVLYPFFPLTPPRELFNDLPGPAVAPLIRKTNFWLLGQYGVGASLFPSGHVAATTALALVLRKYLPRAGLIFLIAAASIAAATVYGRYHYAADAVAGVFVGYLAFFVSNRLRREAQG